MHISINNVVSIELLRHSPGNDDARTVRVVSRDWRGHLFEHEFVFFGETAALAALPKSSDFFARQEAAE